MKEQLFLKIVSVLDRVRDYFNGKLASYRLKQNIKYADAFLKKFRSQPNYDFKWALGKPETWPRKSESLDPSCDHRKGGGSRRGWQHRDYNVGAHTFPDGTQKIWCLYNCGFVSTPNDKNWSLALDMLRESSNKPSSSEVTGTFLAKQNRMVVAVYAEPAPPETHIVTTENRQQIDGVTEQAIQDEYDNEEDNG